MSATTTALDPAETIRAAVRELHDKLRELVDGTDPEDPSLLDKVRKLSNGIGRRITNARKRAEADAAPAEKPAVQRRPCADPAPHPTHEFVAESAWGPTKDTVACPGRSPQPRAAEPAPVKPAAEPPAAPPAAPKTMPAAAAPQPAERVTVKLTEPVRANQSLEKTHPEHVSDRRHARPLAPASEHQPRGRHREPRKPWWARRPLPWRAHALIVALLVLGTAGAFADRNPVWVVGGFVLAMVVHAVAPRNWRRSR